MNHRVPDFYKMDEDCSIPTPSGYPRLKKPATGDEEIMELLWQNGPVVVHSQNQRTSKRSTTATAFGGSEVVTPSDRDIRSTNNNSNNDDEHPQQHQQQHLFMQEDEMASWLQYPLDDSSFDRDFYADLIYSAPLPPPPVATVTPPTRPPPAPPRQPAQNSPRLQNFMHFSRIPSRPAARAEPVSRPNVTVARESTVVESNETPMARHAVADDSNSNRNNNQLAINAESATAAATSASAGKLATGTCELTVTSSPGGSGASFSASGDTHQQQRAAPAAEDRKRKVREADENDCQSEDVEYEAAEAKKPARGSTSTKRSRAAEVHNLSERRRRDRINEKMKALQELIPRCNKSDKASMLDEAIEYLKSLQLQVQMMSMGCGIVPMMYPGMQQYMPAMGMGMGMGMGMDMAMNRPMVPYPPMVPGQAMPNPAAHMGPPRFPMPAFHMPPVDPSRMQAPNQTDHPMLSSVAPHNLNQPQIPNFVDPYQQFRGLHQTQIPVPHNQAMLQPDANKPGTSKEGGNPENRQIG